MASSASWYRDAIFETRPGAWFQNACWDFSQTLMYCCCKQRAAHSGLNADSVKNDGGLCREKRGKAQTSVSAYITKLSAFMTIK